MGWSSSIRGEREGFDDAEIPNPCSRGRSRTLSPSRDSDNELAVNLAYEFDSTEVRAGWMDEDSLDSVLELDCVLSELLLPMERIEEMRLAIALVMYERRTEETAGCTVGASATGKVG